MQNKLNEQVSLSNQRPLNKLQISLRPNESI